MNTNNAFSRFLSEFRGGASITELGEAMQQAVAAVKETGKPAKLKFELTISPQGGAMVITDKVSTKLPDVQRESAIFFATDQNTLQRNDPRQEEFRLKEVVRPAEEALREAAPAAVAVAKG